MRSNESPVDRIVADQVVRRRSNVKRAAQKAGRIGDRQDAFAGRIKPAIDSRVSEHDSRIESSVPLLAIMRIGERTLATAVYGMGRFSGREIRNWEEAFTDGGVALGKKAATVSEVTIPVAAGDSTFGVSYYDQQSNSAGSFELPTFPTDDTSTEFGFKMQRGLYVHTPVSLVRGLAVSSAARTLGRGERAEHRMTTANLVATSVLGEIMAQACLATEINPEAFDAVYQDGFGIADAYSEAESARQPQGA